jgi:glyoxylase-like metal-dependent hydrolase (beta-lactamase superfamily II)
MKVFYHFTSTGFSNTYVVGPGEPGDALVIDPSAFDVALLELIENHGYYIRAILLTHEPDHAFHGIKTIKKVYDAELISAKSHVFDFPATRLTEDTEFTAANFTVNSYFVSGESHESVVYHIGNQFFTGYALSAGLVGNTYSSFNRSVTIQNLRNKILTKEKKLIVLPGNGPPTTIEIEQRINKEILEGV